MHHHSHSHHPPPPQPQQPHAHLTQPAIPSQPRVSPGGIRRPQAPQSLSFNSAQHAFPPPHQNPHTPHGFPSPHPHQSNHPPLHSPPAYPPHFHHQQPLPSPHHPPFTRPARTPSFTHPGPPKNIFSPAGPPPGSAAALAEEPDSYFAFQPPPSDSAPSTAPPTPSGMPGHPHQPQPHMHPYQGNHLSGGQPMPSPHGYPQPGTPGMRIPPSQQAYGGQQGAMAGPGPSATSHAQQQLQHSAPPSGPGTPGAVPTVNGVPIGIAAKKVGGASDFVKKLYKMLEDDQYATVVSWGLSGDSFVVKDMNEFTKTILPRHFKHSNFASFVRQLNKYDFHKVKNPEEGPNAYGDHSWEFRHPNFRADTKNSLDSIKRKAPAARKPPPPVVPDGRTFNGDGAGGTGAVVLTGGSDQYSALQQQVDALNRMQQDMNSHITTLSKDYQSVIGDMLNFQRSMVAQDQLMQNLIQYLVTLEADKKDGNEGQRAIKSSSSSDTPFVPSDQAQKLITSYSDVARASFEQMNEISRRASSAAAGFASFGPGLAQIAGSARQGATHSPDLYAPQPPPGTAGSGTPDSSPSATGSAYGATVAGIVASSPQQTRAGTAGPPPGTGHSTQRGSPPAAFALPGHHPPHLDGASAGSPASPATQPSAPSPVNLTFAPPSSAGHSLGPLGGPNLGSGLRVFTVGHLRPREDGQSSTPGPGGNASPGPSRDGFGLQVPSLSELPADMPQLDATGANAETHGFMPSPGPQGSPDGSGSPGPNGPTLRIRRSTYVPGWAVPPRVLLVEDDAVCRKLSSKFLQVFGCAIDVAVDGVSAVNKMNLEKYDLVLMDIVMPNLDGVSATSLIRQFDPMTPIISMTSNSNPNEIMTYFSHGMNDILPKPFTKEGLLGMLEKHLNHLKAMQQMAELPRALGIPDSQITEMLPNLPNLAASLGAGSGDPALGGANGMSMNDYVAMIQNLVSSAEGDGDVKPVLGQKRIGGPDRDEDERQTKRSRFTEENGDEP